MWLKTNNWHFVMMMYWYIDRSGHRVELHTFLCITYRDNSLDTVRMRHSQNNFLPRLHCLPRNSRLAVNMICGADCCSLVAIVTVSFIVNTARQTISLCFEAWVQLYTIVLSDIYYYKTQFISYIKTLNSSWRKCCTTDSETSSIIHERWNNISTISTAY